MVFSLALAMVVTVSVARSVMLLRLARADLARTQAEFALDGAQLQAAADIIRSGRPGPYRWSFTSDLGWIQAQAEPEVAKASPNVAASWDDGRFEAMGVADRDALRARLRAIRPEDPAFDVTTLDGARLWRACAPTMISGYGVAESFTPPLWAEPGPGSKLPVWHIGEVWRIRVSTSAGWRDDRIIRFTGDARHPAATIVRRFSRGDGDGGACDTIWAG